jgi:hypothetical protein
VVQTRASLDVRRVSFPAGGRGRGGSIFASWLRDGSGTIRFWMQLHFGRGNCCFCGGSWSCSGSSVAGAGATVVQLGVEFFPLS